ncbi:methylisocitrate lyase [Rhodobacteraceae bacterium KLH11]|nr:methylisocitrate lyase [Rhodobacteraceae bacterium KLH11]
MLDVTKDPRDRRATFREALDTGKLQRFAGSFSPFVARLCEQIGFDGVYVPGASLANDLALPDIALTTLTEVNTRAQQIVLATNLPTVLDADTGFGPPQSVYRTAYEMDAAGISCIHIEDQVEPKRCGHLDNKVICSREIMAQRIRAAQDGKRDPNFLVMARTDARAVEGLDAAVDRVKAYVDAGADAIFAEAMHDESEIAAMRAAFDVPLLVNMTAFGQSKLLHKDQLQDLGVNIVIYPNTAFRLAMKAVEDGMTRLFEEGIQTGFIDDLQKRSRLYEILDYSAYNRFDESTFNFDVPDGDGRTKGQVKAAE